MLGDACTLAVGEGLRVGSVGGGWGGSTSYAIERTKSGGDWASRCNCAHCGDCVPCCGCTFCGDETGGGGDPADGME
jgi:hypothetical protein